MLGELYIGYGFIRGRFAGIYYDILGAGLWSPKGVAESPEGDSLHAYPAWGYFSVKKSNQKSLGEDPETPDASEPSRPETLRIPGAGLDDADKVPQAHINLVSVESKIKCAAGTLRAYLRRCTDDAFASFVSSRSLVARGSWGTAPSVFWFLLYAQKERHGGEPYRLSLSGDSATPIGDYQFGLNRSFAYFSS